jgi:hypothetical protein
MLLATRVVPWDWQVTHRAPFRGSRLQRDPRRTLLRRARALRWAPDHAGGEAPGGQ